MKMQHTNLSALALALALSAAPLTSFAGQFFETNGFAIKGFDTVEYFTGKRAVNGSPA